MTATAWKMLRDLFEVFEGGGSAMAGWIKVTGVPERSAYRCAKHLKAMGYVAQSGQKYTVTSAGEMALKGPAT
jgi:DNA-binding IclR family transcriptional regulator